MFLIDVWRRMTGTTGARFSPSRNDDVREELMFHFRALVHDKMAAGQTFDEAWNEAEAQFGAVHHYENECHATQMEQRLTRRMTIALTALVLVAGFAGWQFDVRGRQVKETLLTLEDSLQSLRREQSQQMAHETQIAGERSQPETHDLTGVVLDAESKPLAETTVLIVLKTWPGGSYQQMAFTSTTDAEGEFRLPERIPTGAQYAIQVAAVKEGQAFQSVYQLQDAEPFEKPGPITLQLERAAVVTLVVRDAAGKPIPNVPIIPSARTSENGENHLIYFQGSEALRKATDAAGRVRLSCFSAGDHAEVYLQLPGDDWGSREFEVSADDAVIELAASES